MRDRYLSLSTLTPIQMFGAHSSCLSSSARRSARLVKNLETMPMGMPHDVENLLYVLERHIFVEQVAHRVHENSLRLFPPQRQLEHVRLQRQPEPVAIVPLAHRLRRLAIRSA